MDGWGLYHADTRSNRDWGLVKAISDFGDGDKANSEGSRPAAAWRAATFANRVLADSDLLEGIQSSGMVAGDVSASLHSSPDEVVDAPSSE